MKEVERRLTIERRSDGGVAEARARWPLVRVVHEVEIVEEDFETTERRFSGWFKASRATTPEWSLFEPLAAVFELAGFTNHEARACLLYIGFGKVPKDIGVILGFKRRQAIWRLLRRAGLKIRLRWPDIDDIIEASEGTPKQEAIWILNAFRNSCGSSRTPLYYKLTHEEKWHEWNPPRMVDWRDICKRTDYSIEALGLIDRLGVEAYAGNTAD